jgi:hypothetical protein
VPQVMDLDEPELVLVADAPEGADQVARLDRPSGPGGEYEPAFWPGGAHDGAVGGLLVGLELERLAGEIEQRQAAPSGVGLDRPEEELAADALQLAEPAARRIRGKRGSPGPAFGNDAPRSRGFSSGRVRT